MAVHDRVSCTVGPTGLPALGSGRANRAPAVVIGQAASGGVGLHVLVAHPDRPILVRRDVPAGAVGEPSTCTAASA